MYGVCYDVFFWNIDRLQALFRSRLSKAQGMVERFAPGSSSSFQSRRRSTSCVEFRGWWRIRPWYHRRWSSYGRRSYSEPVDCM
jgi:hypothetical protein